MVEPVARESGPFLDDKIRQACSDFEPFMSWLEKSEFAPANLKSKFPGPVRTRIPTMNSSITQPQMEQNWEMWMDPETIMQSDVKKSKYCM